MLGVIEAAKVAYFFVANVHHSGLVAGVMNMRKLVRIGSCNTFLRIFSDSGICSGKKGQHVRQTLVSMRTRSAMLFISQNQIRTRRMVSLESDDSILAPGMSAKEYQRAISGSATRFSFPGHVQSLLDS